MIDRHQQYQKAYDEFVEKQIQDENVIGILGCGSFFNDSGVDEKSDIDIFIILAENIDFRERGNTWINGVEVEYFKNPPLQIREYIHAEEHKYSAHIFSTGKIIYDKNGIVSELKEEAKIVEDNISKPMQVDEIELAKYFIDDKYKDWQDAVSRNDVVAQKMTQNELEDYCIAIFFKLKRSRRGKSKHLGALIRSIDPYFAALIEDNDIKLTKKYIEKLLGGRRDREWVLKSKLTI